MEALDGSGGKGVIHSMWFGYFVFVLAVNCFTDASKREGWPAELFRLAGGMLSLLFCWWVRQ